METNKKIDRLPSTIVLGIFISFSVLFTIFIYTYSLSYEMEMLNQAQNNSVSINGQISSSLGQGIELAILMIFTFIFAVINLATCLLTTPFAVINTIKCTIPSIRKINLIYSIVLGVILIMNIAKLIVLFTL